MEIVVLGGAGKMAHGANRYLVEQSDISKVVIADYDLKNAEKTVKKLNSKKATAEFADFNDHSSLVRVLKDADAVLNSTVYYSNLKVMKAALETGTHYVDLGGLFHTAKKQFELNDEFEKAGITGVVGLGSAPGIVNVMARYAVDQLDKVEYIRIRDGIVNFVKTKAPLTPPYAIDTILDEFTMDAPVFENGEFKEVPPFSGGEVVDYPEPVGKCVSYNTIHTEVWTLSNSFKNKGVKEVNFKLALPKAFEEKMRFLVSLGFGSKEPIKAKDIKVAPRDILIALLSRFPKEDVEPDDHKVLRVEVKGEKNSETLEIIVEVIIHPNKKYHLSAGTLSVGGPGAIVARILAGRSIKQRGVFPPEKCVDPIFFFKELAKWDMRVYSIVKRSV